MTASAAFIAMVEELLAGLGPVAVRRMFGGAGLYADGVMFALVADDVLYLKADDTTRQHFEAEGCGPFVYAGQGKPVTMSYWRAPERLYDDGEQMCAWAGRALAVARRAKAARGARPAGGRTVRRGSRARDR